MIDKITTEYRLINKLEFIQDDNQELSWLSEFESNNFDRFFIFIDNNVKNIWGDKILSKLSMHEKTIIILELEADENTKSINFYCTALDFLETNRCTRFDLIIAIGGGIVLDMVSFVVSTYMRGITMYMIPTTLIGQTDASTAGKTCLNTKKSKNLLGTFYYPEIVYNNINFLYTNTNRFLRQGFSECFKYGLLNSECLINSLLEYNKNNNHEILKDIISQTIKSRIAIRQIDALASNLGHTFGHALEKFSGYTILHGDAISTGIVMALNYAVFINVMSPEVKDKIIGLMKILGLNIYVDKMLTSQKLLDFMLADKKSSSSHLNLVLVKNIAEPYSEDGKFFCKSKPEKVELFLDNFLKNYEYKIANCSEFLRKDFIHY